MLFFRGIVLYINISWIFKWLSSYYEKILATGEVKCIDEEIPFELPNGWEWERWGNVSQSIQYGYNAPALPSGDIRMVRISDIQNNKVLWKTVPFCQIPQNEIETYLLSPNDILFARTGGTVGKSFLVEDIPVDSIYAGYLIRTRYSQLLCPKYLKYYMESQLYWEQLKNGTIATAQPNCNGKTLGHMLLPIPPVNEQLKIVEKLDEVATHLEKYGKSQEQMNVLNLSINGSLKKSILQEAIQGRLVPQIAEEGTATELLEQIKKEKLYLVKEGKLKKSALADSVVYKGDDNKYYEQVGKNCIDITDKIPFDIPENWQWVRFGQIVRMDIGKTPTRGDSRYWANTAKNWVSISDMADYCHIKATKEKISETAASAIMGNISPIGTLLMSFKLTVGRTSILDIEAYHNEAIVSIYPYVDNNYALRDYLFYSLPILANMGESKDAIKGKTLNSKSLNKLLVPLPPLKEQRHIISMLVELYARL